MFHNFIQFLKKNLDNFLNPKNEIKFFFEKILEDKELYYHLYYIQYKICLFYFIIILLYSILWSFFIFVILKFLYNEIQLAMGKKNFENFEKEKFFLDIIVKYADYFIVIIFILFVLIFDLSVERVNYCHYFEILRIKFLALFSLFLVWFKFNLMLDLIMKKLIKIIQFTAISLNFFLIFFPKTYVYFWGSLILIVIISIIIFFIANSPYLKVIYFFEKLFSSVNNEKKRLALFSFLNKIKSSFEKKFSTKWE